MRIEAELAVGITQPAEARDERHPCTGERSYVQAVAGVVMDVVQVDKGRFVGIVVRQLEMTDLGTDDRLHVRRQRRVAHGSRLVVVDVAGLVRVAEAVPERAHRELEVGLLDDLAAIQLEVRHVQQQWIRLT